MDRISTVFVYLLAIYMCGVSSQKRIIRMKTGDTLEIASDKYPDLSNSANDQWMLGTSSGGVIKLECQDIRINTETCDQGFLMVSAGDSPRVLCGRTVNSFSKTSLFESLYLEFVLNSIDGAYKCVATALATPAPIETRKKNVFVKTGTVNHEINNFSLERVKRYEYDVTTDPGSALLATCFLSHEYFKEDGECEALSLTLKSGTKEKKYCKSISNIAFQSDDADLKISLQTGLHVGPGFFSCHVRSLKSGGGSYSNYKEIASEEVDSSEHGLMSKRGHKSTTCNCGWANKDGRRVIFGYDAGDHEYPWAVSLQSLSGFHFCGGSIISEYHVLTVAHCVAGKSPDFQVVMGTNKLSERSNAIRVKEIINHDYNRTSTQNDISLLVLEKKIEFNQFIGPICLPSKKPNIDHQYVTAMGWGRLGEGEYAYKDPELLKETKLRAVDSHSCTIDWNFKWDLANSKVMCTWSNHTDICMGDSGGPVVWLDPETNRYTLMGMPSLCDGCRLILPSVHTSVYHFYDWIQTKIAASAQPEGKTCTKVD